ncbi:hypothetical protein [Sphingobium sp.]|uniref:hypothetical protein n=1 Tax=Sphingobium sp. TaxID=1912891 RepID=UPI003B3B95F2
MAQLQHAHAAYMPGNAVAAFSDPVDQAAGVLAPILPEWTLYGDAMSIADDGIRQLSRMTGMGAIAATGFAMVAILFKLI